MGNFAVLEKSLIYDQSRLTAEAIRRTLEPEIKLEGGGKKA